VFTISASAEDSRCRSKSFAWRLFPVSPGSRRSLRRQPQRIGENLVVASPPYLWRLFPICSSHTRWWQKIDTGEIRALTAI